MARKTDVIDRMLEHWATWRITMDIYDGTGPSVLVRFREPAGTNFIGSRPLFQGIPNRRLAALNSDLNIHLGSEKLNYLIALYGMPGRDSYKANYLGISLYSIKKIRKQARLVVFQHISPTIRLTAGEHND